MVLPWGHLILLHLKIGLICGERKTQSFETTIFSSINICRNKKREQNYQLDLFAWTFLPVAINKMAEAIQCTQVENFEWNA